jgi:hypothetical protein
MSLAGELVLKTFSTEPPTNYAKARVVLLGFWCYILPSPIKKSRFRRALM